MEPLGRNTVAIRCRSMAAPAVGKTLASQSQPSSRMAAPITCGTPAMRAGLSASVTPPPVTALPGLRTRPIPVWDLGVPGAWVLAARLWPYCAKGGGGIQALVFRRDTARRLADRLCAVAQRQRLDAVARCSSRKAHRTPLTLPVPTILRSWLRWHRKKRVVRWSEQQWR